MAPQNKITVTTQWLPGHPTHVIKSEIKNSSQVSRKLDPKTDARSSPEKGAGRIREPMKALCSHGRGLEGTKELNQA